MKLRDKKALINPTNRTILELKRATIQIIRGGEWTTNRTILELKRKKTYRRGLGKLHYP